MLTNVSLSNQIGQKVVASMHLCNYTVILIHLILGYFRKAQALFGLGCPNMAYKYLTVSLSQLGAPSSSTASLRQDILSEIGCNLRYLGLSPLYKDLPGTCATSFDST